MLSLDPCTIIFVATILYFMLGPAMLFFSAALKRYRGPGFWAVGTCGWAVCGTLIFFAKAFCRIG